MADELKLYPRTGRFLSGRLRSALSGDEKETLEAIVASERAFADGEHIASRGELCENSTLLIEGFIVRVIERKGKPHIVGLQVAGDDATVPFRERDDRPLRQRR